MAATLVTSRPLPLFNPIQCKRFTSATLFIQSQLLESHLKPLKSLKTPIIRPMKAKAVSINIGQDFHSGLGLGLRQGLNKELAQGYGKE